MEIYVSDDKLEVYEPIGGTNFAKVIVEIPKEAFIECFNKWIKEGEKMDDAIKKAIEFVRSDDFNEFYPEEVLDYSMPILEAIRNGYTLTKEVVKNET